MSNRIVPFLSALGALSHCFWLFASSPRLPQCPQDLGGGADGGNSVCIGYSRPQLGSVSAQAMPEFYPINAPPRRPWQLWLAGVLIGGGIGIGFRRYWKREWRMADDLGKIFAAQFCKRWNRSPVYPQFMQIRYRVSGWPLPRAKVFIALNDRYKDFGLGNFCLRRAREEVVEILRVLGWRSTVASYSKVSGISAMIELVRQKRG